jgi:pimeloyl-ACP methyl ester carboxylesterase
VVIKNRIYKTETYLLFFLFFLNTGVAMNVQPKESNKQSGKVKANGIELYYEKTGEGPYLILIEGLGASLYLWEKQIPELSKHFTVIAYDNRGVGKTDKPAGPYTINMMAKDLAGLMDALDIPKADILGVSMGGFIAQEFTLLYPEKVNKLVIAATSAGGKDHVPMSQETLSLVLAASGESRDIIKKKLALVYTKEYLSNKETIEHLVDLRIQNPQSPEAYQAQAMAGMTFDRSEEVKNINKPTIILGATEDLLVPVQNSYNLNKKINNSKLKIFKGYGHQFFVEDAVEFNNEVINFLTED